MSKWVALGGSATRSSSRISTWAWDFVATQEDFIPLPDKSDVAPALGVSFDIETYSPNTPRSVEDFNIMFARWRSGSTADPTRGDFELSGDLGHGARARGGSSRSGDAARLLPGREGGTRGPRGRPPTVRSWSACVGTCETPTATMAATMTATTPP